MRSLFRAWQLGLVGVLMAAAGGAAFAAGSPFVNSRSEPHAVLYLNYKMVPKRIYPVRLWMVDGQLTNRSEQEVVWMKPGDYNVTIKLTKVINLDYIPGLKQRMSDAKQMHAIKLSLQAGHAYYLGAKFDASGAWQPVVWKSENTQ